MSTIHLTRRGLLLGLSTLAIAAITTPARADKQAIAVLVSEKSKLNELSLSALRRLFQSKAVNGPDGTRLVAVNLPGSSAVRQAFDKAVLRMDPEEVGRYWIDQSIRGSAKPPRTVDSVGALMKLLHNNAAAVGYAPVSVLSSHSRVIRIEGKLGSDAEYPIMMG